MGLGGFLSIDSWCYIYDLGQLKPTVIPTLVDTTPPITRLPVTSGTPAVQMKVSPTLSVFPPQGREVFSIEAQRIFSGLGTNIFVRVFGFPPPFPAGRAGRFFTNFRDSSFIDQSLVSLRSSSVYPLGVWGWAKAFSFPPPISAKVLEVFYLLVFRFFFSGSEGFFYKVQRILRH